MKYSVGFWLKDEDNTQTFRVYAQFLSLSDAKMFRDVVNARMEKEGDTTQFRVIQIW